ncbi:hypothetical protein DFJ73DRAFT_771844 [Zopfochytrium polystomum]|nr:hypothetical protein DFJ73DRAFT_771844 [Zopfochytrium polystomum]
MAATLGGPSASSPSSPTMTPIRRLGGTSSLDEIRLLQAMRALGMTTPPSVAMTTSSVGSPPVLNRRPSGGSGLLSRGVPPPGATEEDMLSLAMMGRFARRVHSTHAMLSSPASTSSLADPAVQELWNDHSHLASHHLAQQQQQHLHDVALSGADFSNIPILVTNPDDPDRSFFLPPSAVLADPAAAAAALKSAGGRDYLMVGDEVMFLGSGAGPQGVGMPRSKSLDLRDPRTPGMKSDPHQPLRQPAGSPSTSMGGSGARSVSEWPSLNRRQSSMLKPQMSAGSLGMHQPSSASSTASSPSVHSQPAPGKVALF